MKHIVAHLATLMMVCLATLNMRAGGVIGFTTYGGSWQTKDGVLSVSADAGAKLIADTPAFATGEVGVEMLLPEAGGGNAGLIVKVSEAGVGADRFNGYEISLDANRQMLRLGRHRQNFELLRDVPCTVPVDQWIALVVRLTDTAIEVKVNDKTMLTYDDREHPLALGRVGFRPWQRRAQFRNFRITTNGHLQTIPFVAAQPVALVTTPLPPIAFIARHPLSAPFAVAQDLWMAQPRAPGCSIRIFDGQTTKHIFDDPTGCIYDMNVSYDAKMLLFSYRRQDEKYWHLWRINTDGTG
ncbi:MAG: family 16 glycoside hydrolase, partial [bacterium]